MPANPVKGCDGRFIDCNDDSVNWLNQCKPSIGMTKREEFAMAAMQGLCAGNIENRGTYEDISIGAVLLADLLLEELSK